LTFGTDDASGSFGTFLGRSIKTVVATQKINYIAELQIEKAACAAFDVDTC
jgi:hypothetical protein